MTYGIASSHNNGGEGFAMANAVPSFFPCDKFAFVKTAYLYLYRTGGFTWSTETMSNLNWSELLLLQSLPLLNSIVSTGGKMGTSDVKWVG